MLREFCIVCVRPSSAFNKNGDSKLSRKFIPSLPDFGSLELIEKAGTHPAESSIPELLGFTSSLMHLLFQVTKLHKGIAEKVLLEMQGLVGWEGGGGVGVEGPCLHFS